MFLMECIFGPLCFFFAFYFEFVYSFLFSLSVIVLFRWILYASASETSRVGFTEFLLQKIRGGGVCTTGGGDK